MISRKSTLSLAEAYAARFSYLDRYDRRPAEKGKVYDFFYENDLPGWFCNEMKRCNYSRALKECILKLHTGETLLGVTDGWPLEQRERLGQRYLLDLANALFTNADFFSRFTTLQKLIHNLELDGYMLQESRLLAPETDVLDVEQETSLLKSLYSSLSLSNEEITFNHLDLSETHYLNENWGDSIGNSRHFFESILREIAAAHSLRKQGASLPETTLKRAVEVRKYLERANLLESKEKEAVASIYGLLSDTGGHPNMAESDQARLMRNLALTFSQFVMLRLQGALGQTS